MVYIDNFNAPFRRMKMCHMVADTTDELIAMAEKVGVHRKWIQEPGTYNEHFDICLSAKAKAIALGAKEINFRDYARITNSRLGSPFYKPFDVKDLIPMPGSKEDHRRDQIENDFFSGYPTKDHGN